MYYESAAWGKYCKAVFGSDLKQVGMVTDEELSTFLNEAAVLPNSVALDLGCGAGFMTKKVSDEMNVHVTGINIEDSEVQFAQKHFADNPNLTFMQMDFNKLSFPDNTSFDLIYSFDSLYFTFSIEKLHSLLDSCINLLNPNGKLAVFWTNMPKVYPMESPDSSSTQVGIWAAKRNITYKSIDFTQSHRMFWTNGLKILTEMEQQFRLENYSYYEQHVNEYKVVSELCDSGDIFRWLYVFVK